MSEDWIGSPTMEKTPTSIDKRRAFGSKKSMASGFMAKKDPYQLDFRELKKEYVRDTNVKLPFVKSSFVHYAACPLNIQLGELKLEDELVLTMELVQAPGHVKNMNLTDPKLKKKMAEAELKKQRAQER